MQSWRTLTSRPLLDRQPWLTVWEEDVRLPDDTIIRGYLRSRARDYRHGFRLASRWHGATGPAVQTRPGQSQASICLLATWMGRLNHR